MANILSALRNAVKGPAIGIAAGVSNASNQLPALMQMAMQKREREKEKLKADLQLAIGMRNIPAAKQIAEKIYGPGNAMVNNIDLYMQKLMEKDARELAGPIGFSPGSNIPYYEGSGQTLPPDHPLTQAQRNYQSGFDAIYPSEGIGKTRSGEISPLYEKPSGESLTEYVQNFRRSRLKEKFKIDKALAEYKDKLTYTRQDLLQKAQFERQKAAEIAKTTADVLKYVDTQGRLNMTPEGAEDYALTTLSAIDDPNAKEVAEVAKQLVAKQRLRPDLTSSAFDDLAEYASVQAAADEMIGLLENDTVKSYLGRIDAPIASVKKWATGEKGLPKDVVRFNFLLLNTIDILGRARSGAQLTETEQELYRELIGTQAKDHKAIQYRLAELIDSLNLLSINIYKQGLDRAYGAGYSNDPKILAKIPKYRRIHQVRAQHLPAKDE